MRLLGTVNFEIVRTNGILLRGPHWLIPLIFDFHGSIIHFIFNQIRLNSYLF